MRRFGGSCLALAMAAALGGCASPVVTQTSYDVAFRAGVPSEFAYAASPAGTMPVVVVGNPFALPKLSVDQRVVAAMQGNNYGAAVLFVAVPAEAAPAGYAVVVLLNAAAGTSADLLCARRGTLAPPPPSPPPPGPMTLLAAFCGNADARSWAWSRTGPLASPDDPRFGKLVARTTFAMLPPRDDAPGRGDYR